MNVKKIPFRCRRCPVSDFSQSLTGIPHGKTGAEVLPAPPPFAPRDALSHLPHDCRVSEARASHIHERLYSATLDMAPGGLILQRSEKNVILGILCSAYARQFGPE